MYLTRHRKQPHKVELFLRNEFCSMGRNTSPAEVYHWRRSFLSFLSASDWVSKHIQNPKHNMRKTETENSITPSTWCHIISDETDNNPKSSYNPANNHKNVHLTLAKNWKHSYVPRKAKVYASYFLLACFISLVSSICGSFILGRFASSTIIQIKQQSG